MTSGASSDASPSAGTAGGLLAPPEAAFAEALGPGRPGESVAYFKQVSTYPTSDGLVVRVELRHLRQAESVSRNILPWVEGVRQTLGAKSLHVVYRPSSATALAARGRKRAPLPASALADLAFDVRAGLSRAAGGAVAGVCSAKFPLERRVKVIEIALCAWSRPERMSFILSPEALPSWPAVRAWLGSGLRFEVAWDFGDVSGHDRARLLRRQETLPAWF